MQINRHASKQNQNILSLVEPHTCPHRSKSSTTSSITKKLLKLHIIHPNHYICSICWFLARLRG